MIRKRGGETDLLHIADVAAQDLQLLAGSLTTFAEHNRLSRGGKAHIHDLVVRAKAISASLRAECRASQADRGLVRSLLSAAGRTANIAAATITIYGAALGVGDDESVRQAIEQQCQNIVEQVQEIDVDQVDSPPEHIPDPIDVDDKANAPQDRSEGAPTSESETQSTGDNKGVPGPPPADPHGGDNVEGPVETAFAAGDVAYWQAPGGGQMTVMIHDLMPEFGLAIVEEVGMDNETFEVNIEDLLPE